MNWIKNIIARWYKPTPDPQIIRIHATVDEIKGMLEQSTIPKAKVDEFLVKLTEKTNAGKLPAIEVTE